MQAYCQRNYALMLLNLSTFGAELLKFIHQNQENEPFFVKLQPFFVKSVALLLNWWINYLHFHEMIWSGAEYPVIGAEYPVHFHKPSSVVFCTSK